MRPLGFRMPNSACSLASLSFSSAALLALAAAAALVVVVSAASSSSLRMRVDCWWL